MSYTYNPIYTHFKGDHITRSERIERMVTDIILKSPLPDEDRAWSKTFELKHSASVAKIGRMLAQQRGLDENLAVIICALHDIYVFETGRVTDHGPKGAPIAEKILRETKEFTEDEIKLITKAVKNHSDKHIISKDPYIELIKDADVFDCSLYEGVHDAYVYEKSEETCKHYFARVRRIREELNLPAEKQWSVYEMVGDKAREYMVRHKE